jgi:hypothetical protein
MSGLYSQGGGGAGECCIGWRVGAEAKNISDFQHLVKYKCATEWDTTTMMCSWGDSSAKTWESMGFITRLPSGGYEMTRSGAVAQTNPDAGKGAEATQVPAPDPDEAAVSGADLVGVKGTSAQADATLTQIRDGAPAQMEAVLHAVGSDIEPDWNEIAKQTQDESILQRGPAMLAEYHAAGRQILSNLGVQDHDALTAWAVAEAPEKARDAVREMVNGNAAPLAALGRRYARSAPAAMAAAQYTDSEVANAQAGAGVRILNTDFGPMIKVKGQRYKLAEAQRLGLVRVTRR